MERFEDLGRRLFHVRKGAPKRAEDVAEKVIDETLGPPPAGGPALADEED